MKVESFGKYILNFLFVILTCRRSFRNDFNIFGKMKLKRLIIILVLISLFCCRAMGYFANCPASSLKDKDQRFCVVTYISDIKQVRCLSVLIKSIRKNGGKVSKCPIYVVVTDPDLQLPVSVKDEGVLFLPIEMDRQYLSYPLALKAFAAAQVERILSKKKVTLAWFDPETIVTGQPDGLILKRGFSVAARPVFLSNTIGLKPGDPPDDYWTPVYKALNLKAEDVPVVESVIDQVQMRAYYNCEIISVDPTLGIFSKWAETLEMLLKDSFYQNSVCNTFMRRLFLHQAVLSGVISSLTVPDEIRSLPAGCGYPLNLHMKMKPEQRITSLNIVSCAILENLWAVDMKWMENIQIDEPLKSWIEMVYREYLDEVKSVRDK